MKIACFVEWLAMSNATIDIEKLSGDIYIVRGYPTADTLDYVGGCVIVPNNLDYEIRLWIVKNDAPKDYLKSVLDTIRTKISCNLTAHIETKKYRIYRKYFNRHGYDLHPIKIVHKEYNGASGLFYYSYIKEISAGVE